MTKKNEDPKREKFVAKAPSIITGPLATFLTVLWLLAFCGSLSRRQQNLIDGCDIADLCDGIRTLSLENPGPDSRATTMLAYLLHGVALEYKHRSEMLLKDSLSLQKRLRQARQESLKRAQDGELVFNPLAHVVREDGFSLDRLSTEDGELDHQVHQANASSITLQDVPSTSYANPYGGERFDDFLSDTDIPSTSDSFPNPNHGEGQPSTATVSDLAQQFEACRVTRAGQDQDIFPYETDFDAHYETEPGRGDVSDSGPELQATEAENLPANVTRTFTDQQVGEEDGRIRVDIRGIGSEGVGEEDTVAENVLAIAAAYAEQAPPDIGVVEERAPSVPNIGVVEERALPVVEERAPSVPNIVVVEGQGPPVPNIGVVEEPVVEDETPPVVVEQPAAVVEDEAPPVVVEQAAAVVEDEAPPVVVEQAAAEPRRGAKRKCTSDINYRELYLDEVIKRKKRRKPRSRQPRSSEDAIQNVPSADAGRNDTQVNSDVEDGHNDTQVNSDVQDDVLERNEVVSETVQPVPLERDEGAVLDHGFIEIDESFHIDEDHLVPDNDHQVPLDNDEESPVPVANIDYVFGPEWWSLNARGVEENWSRETAVENFIYYMGLSHLTEGQRQQGYAPVYEMRQRHNTGEIMLRELPRSSSALIPEPLYLKKTDE